jgi:hypothetical protein
MGVGEALENLKKFRYKNPQKWGFFDGKYLLFTIQVVYYK